MDLSTADTDMLRTFVNVTAPNDLAMMEPGNAREYVEQLQMAAFKELLRRNASLAV